MVFSGEITRIVEALEADTTGPSPEIAEGLAIALNALRDQDDDDHVVLAGRAAWALRHTDSEGACYAAVVALLRLFATRAPVPERDVGRLGDFLVEDVAPAYQIAALTMMLVMFSACPPTHHAVELVDLWRKLRRLTAEPTPTTTLRARRNVAWCARILTGDEALGDVPATLAAIDRWQIALHAERFVANVRQLRLWEDHPLAQEAFEQAERYLKALKADLTWIDGRLQQNNPSKP